MILDTQKTRRCEGLVEFTCGNTKGQGYGVLLKPKPERMSPHAEEASADGSEDSSSSQSSSSIQQQGELEKSEDTPPLVEGSASMIIGRLELSKSPPEECTILSLAYSSDEEDDGGVTRNEPMILPQHSTLHATGNPFGKQSKGVVARRVYETSSTTAKRVLSSNTLATLNAEAGHKDDSPKRMRTSPEQLGPRTLNDVPELSLGLSLLEAVRPLQLRTDEYYRGSPISSSNTDEELDEALSQELVRSTSDNRNSEKSPVPLLTPPQSPLTLISDHYCGLVEWPSNLVIDSAMMSAATCTRPLSPLSLQKFEAEEERRLNVANTRLKSSTLTPLLRSINVGTK